MCKATYKVAAKVGSRLTLQYVYEDGSAKWFVHVGGDYCYELEAGGNISRRDWDDPLEDGAASSRTRHKQEGTDEDVEKVQSEPVQSG